MNFKVKAKLNLSKIKTYSNTNIHKINYQHNASTYTPNQNEENYIEDKNTEINNNDENYNFLDFLDNLGIGTIFADILMAQYAASNGVMNLEAQTESLLSFLQGFTSDIPEALFNSQALANDFNKNISNVLNSNNNDQYSDFFSTDYGSKINDMASDNMKYGGEAYNQIVSSSHSALIAAYILQNSFPSFEELATTAGCDIAMIAFGFTQGAMSKGEDFLDAGLSLIGLFTPAVDYFAGTNYTDEINAFIAEDHINNLFNDFYESTPQGQFINRNASEFIQYGNFGYNLVSGAGSVFTIIISAKIAAYLLPAAVPAAAPLLATKLGASVLLGGVAGTAGFGKGRAQSLQEGANHVESYIAGALTGTWEGAQWLTGAQLSGRGAISVFADVVGAGFDPFVYSFIESKYNDKSMMENFEENGGVEAMLSNMSLAGLLSGLSEIREYRKTASRNTITTQNQDNTSKVNINDNPISTQNLTNDISDMRRLLDDSNVTKNYSDFLDSYRNEYAGSLDEFDNSRMALYQMHQRLFIDSGLESTLDNLEKYGLANGQSAGYARRTIQYYLDTGDSSVFTRQNGIREFMTSYSREDLANLINLRGQYENLLSTTNLHNSSASLNNSKRYVTSTVDAAILTGDAKQYLFQKLTRKAQSNPQLRAELEKLRSDTVYWPNDGVRNTNSATALYDEQKLVDLGNRYLDGNEMNQYFQIKNNGSYLYEHEYQYTPQDKNVIFAQTRNSGTLVNNWLRGNVPTEEVQRQLNLISKTYNIPQMTPETIIQTYDNIIENSVLKEPIVTYSGVNNLYIDGNKLQISDLEPGVRIQDSAYRSASLVEGLEYNRKIKLEITAPAGTHAAYIESYSGLANYHLQEVIFPRNSILEITGYPRYDSLTGQVTIPCTIVEE